MRLVIMIFLLLISVKLMAPSAKSLFIEKIEPVKFDPMLRAFMRVESNFRTNVVNSIGYYGILQIGPEMIEDVNRICRIKGKMPPVSYTIHPDSLKSVEIWYIIQNYYNGAYDLKRASRIWNSKGGEKYYLKVKKAIKPII